MKLRIYKITNAKDKTSELAISDIIEIVQKSKALALKIEKLLNENLY